MKEKWSDSRQYPGISLRGMGGEGHEIVRQGNRE